MSDTGVSYRVDGVRGVITLDRQRTRNALDVAGLTAVIDALDAAAADERVRCVVLGHAGSVFSSGADLSVAASAEPADQPVAHLPAVLQAIRNCPKPVVAAIDGKVRAGGVGLAAVCDLVVATGHSDFATTEVRLGVVPYVISIAFLERVPLGAARRWLLTGAVMRAAVAHRDGLVDVLTDDLAGTVEALVSELACGGPLALAATKRLLQGNTDPGALAARYAELAAASAETFTSHEARAGIAALRAKKPPPWAP